MSRALVCDNCGDSIPLNDRGENPEGEDASWLHLKTTFGAYDLCTRSCAVQLIDSDEFAAQVDREAEVIAEIVRAIGDDEGDDDV